MKNTFILFLAGCMVLWIAGCDSTENSFHQPEVVVEAYLVSGDTLPRIRVSRSLSVNRDYNFTTSAIVGADVTISQLAEDGSVVETFFFADVDEFPGIYTPVNNTVVLPLTTYELQVNGVGQTVSARTLVPGAFELVRSNADTIFYQSDDQLELDLTRSEYPTRQNVFIFSTEALNPQFDLLTPFYRDISDEDDIEELRITQSPLINEANYDLNDDGTITVRLPWLAVAFYGPNRLLASAVDDNLFDFLRSYFVQQGGSTFSPGEIPNVLDQVENGTGVFGSVSRSEFTVFIEPLTTAN